MNCRVKCISTALLLAVFSLASVACGRDVDKDKQAALPTNPGSGAKQQPLAPDEILPVSGQVLEILDTGSFLFVSLDWQGKKVWTTVPGVELKVGEMISLDHATMIKDFHSKALNRTFDELIFASGVIGKPHRPRTVNTANLKDPKNRRSGQLMNGTVPSPVPPAPAKPQGLAKPGAKSGH